MPSAAAGNGNYSATLGRAPTGPTGDRGVTANSPGPSVYRLGPRTAKPGGHPQVDLGPSEAARAAHRRPPAGVLPAWAAMVIGSMIMDLGGAEAVSPNSAHLGPGARFDWWELEAELGRGGSGVVYRARDLRTDERVALKCLDRGGESDLVHEFRVLGGLRHPNLVKLRELGQHRGHAYFTMDLVDGAGLLTFLTASLHDQHPTSVRRCFAPRRCIAAPTHRRAGASRYQTRQCLGGELGEGRSPRLRPDSSHRTVHEPRRRYRVGDPGVHGPRTFSRQAR